MRTTRGCFYAEPPQLDLILQFVLGATTSLGFSYYSVLMPCYAMIYFLLPGRRAFTILLLRGAVYFLYCLGAGRFRHVTMPSHTFGSLVFIADHVTLSPSSETADSATGSLEGWLPEHSCRITFGCVVMPHFSFARLIERVMIFGTPLQG